MRFTFTALLVPHHQGRPLLPFYGLSAPPLLSPPPCSDLTLRASHLALQCSSSRTSRTACPATPATSTSPRSTPPTRSPSFLRAACACRASWRPRTTRYLCRGGTAHGTPTIARTSPYGRGTRQGHYAHERPLPVRHDRDAHQSAEGLWQLAGRVVERLLWLHRGVVRRVPPPGGLPLPLRAVLAARSSISSSTSRRSTPGTLRAAREKLHKPHAFAREREREIRTSHHTSPLPSHTTLLTSLARCAGTGAPTRCPSTHPTSTSA